MSVNSARNRVRILAIVSISPKNNQCSPLGMAVANQRGGGFENYETELLE